jgi:hypothetical protein
MGAALQYLVELGCLLFAEAGLASIPIDPSIHLAQKSDFPVVQPATGQRGLDLLLEWLHLVWRIEHPFFSVGRNAVTFAARACDLLTELGASCFTGLGRR